MTISREPDQCSTPCRWEAKASMVRLPHVDPQSNSYTVGPDSSLGRLGGTVSKPRPFWLAAEYTVAHSLRQRGVKCKNVGHLKLAWDVETRGRLRLDVKFSDLTSRGRWVINLRRRGVKLHGRPNFFVVVLRGVRGPQGLKKQNSLFVVLDAKKYAKKTILIWTVRSLLMKHSREVGAWSRLVAAE